MAILVSGGAGYIGSHTVYELIDADLEVIVSSAWSWHKAHPNGYREG